MSLIKNKVTERSELIALCFRFLPDALFLKLLFVLAAEHTLLHMFLNIWRQILFLGDLRDDAL